LWAQGHDIHEGINIVAFAWVSHALGIDVVVVGGSSRGGLHIKQLGGEAYRLHGNAQETTLEEQGDGSSLEE